MQETAEVRADPHPLGVLRQRAGVIDSGHVLRAWPSALGAPARQVARYARGRDYTRAAQARAASRRDPARWRPHGARGVDTMPLYERAWAQRWRGFIGKNCC